MLLACVITDHPRLGCGRSLDWPRVSRTLPAEAVSFPVHERVTDAREGTS